jgi:hypothetical protein
VTGQLRGSIDGRPVIIEGEDEHIVLRVSDLRSAWRLRRRIPPGIPRLRRVLQERRLRLDLRIRDGRSIQLLPNPGLLVRLASKELRGG